MSSLLDVAGEKKCEEKDKNKGVKCDICNRCNEHDDDVLHYGEWMIKQNVTVHYYCLLLSTNLPQRGGDSGGILGFLLRDLRIEIAAAKRRKCAFCEKTGASVVCHKCRIVFHLGCGMENHCISHFCDEFRSYCESCAPLDSYKRQLLVNPPKNAPCDICFRVISPFLLQSVAYGDCCRKGFAHRTCMRRYALASGYYLRCLWCRNEKFRDTIRLQCVFVPDRDATWELQPNAYSELHHRSLSCDQQKCICPKGRNFNKQSWTIQLCILCAATGTHLKCRVGTLRLSRTTDKEMPDFKCSHCEVMEKKIIKTKSIRLDKEPQKKSVSETADEQVDTSFFLTKKCCDQNMATDVASPEQSEDEASTSNEASIITVVRSQSPLRLDSSCGSIVEPTQLTTPVFDCSPAIELSDDSQQLTSLVPQPPLLLHKSFTCADHFYLEVYDFTEKDPMVCTGTCTLRFDLNDFRIQDRSENALQQLQLYESDIWFRDYNRDINDKID